MEKDQIKVIQYYPEEIAFDDRAIYLKLNKMTDREVLAYCINSHLIINKRNNKQNKRFIIKEEKR